MNGTLCMIAEGCGPYDAISKIAADEVRHAVAAGWRVSVVAHRIDPQIAALAEHLPLFNWKRGFTLKWLTARHFIRRAMAGRRFDVVHGHQPQIADLCDVFQCHFLTRAAHERGCLSVGTGWRGRLAGLQGRLVLPAEDAFYRGMSARTRMLFNSELTRVEFEKFYGVPRRAEVSACAAPPFDPVAPEERAAARQRFIGRDPVPVVVGFLGGLDERKGYRRILAAMEREPGLFLLMAGSACHGFTSPTLGDRCVALGMVDTRPFYAACDALVVCSLFEPLGLVAYEAAARGIPVIATEEVGALPELLQFGIGMRWDAAAPLAPLIQRASAGRDAFASKAQAWCRARCGDTHYRRLLDIYNDVLHEKRSETSRTGAGARRITGAAS